MLTQLHISNYALIEALDIDFEQGMTIITGETGAGKSIIIGALGVLLGGRGDAKSIRNPEKKAVIEAHFNIKAYDLEKFFADNDIEYFADECIVRRELHPNGRTRVFVNDSPASVSTLRDLAMQLVDIHSQHSNLLLSQPAYQLAVIDSMAANQQEKAVYEQSYASYLALSRELKELQSQFDKSKAEEDYIRFQVQSLEAMKLQKGEDAELESLEKKLSNLSEIKESLWAVINLLDGEEVSVINNLKEALRNLSHASNLYDELGDLPSRMDSALIDIRDIFSSVNDLQEGLDMDPSELDNVQNRLNDIYTLERKHNVSSVDELIAICEEYSNKLQLIDNSDELIKQKEKELAQAQKDMMSCAKLLSDTRKAAAKQFASLLQPMAVDLGMKNIVFDVQFSEVAAGANGIDSVEFCAAFNKQQALMPISSTASGGEISRLMLCIKTIIARTMNLPTIIFDEVDTGVSGGVASKIGDMMKSLSEKIQVISITHLPQVAAVADSHKRVSKSDVGDSTVTTLETLSQDERVLELARMLSGKNVGEEAMQNARALMGLNSK